MSGIRLPYSDRRGADKESRARSYTHSLAEDEPSGEKVAMVTVAQPLQRDGCMTASLAAPFVPPSSPHVLQSCSDDAPDTRVSEVSVDD